MERRGRPASESYQSVCCSGSPSVSLSSGAERVGLEDEDDQAPIFSLSKSSMDVVMVSGLPHKRDPAWARTDLRRSSSTNTHSEQTSMMLQQLHPHMWQHINTASSQQLSHATQNVDMHSPPVLSGRWIDNMQRWSGCSASTQSRSSTPDTIVWKEENSRPSSLTQETPCPVVPDSPVSKPTSPPATPTPSISPLQTPTLTTSSSSILALNAHQQKDILETLPMPSPPQSPRQASTSSPVPSNSPYALHLTSTEDEGFLENNMLSFTFPSPMLSSVSLAEGSMPSDAGSLIDDVIEDLKSPGVTKLSESGSMRSPLQVFSHLKPDSCSSPELQSPGVTLLVDSGGVNSPVQMFSYQKPDFCASQEIHTPGSTQLSESEGMRSPVQMFGYPKHDFCRSQEIHTPGSTQLSESEGMRSPVQMFGYPKHDFCRSQEIHSPGSTQLSESEGVRSPVQMFGYPKHDFCRSQEIHSPGSTQLSESEGVRSPVQMFSYQKPDFCPSQEIHSPGHTQLSGSEGVRSPVQMFGHPKPGFCPSQEIHSPGSTQLSESEGVRGPVQMFSYPKPISPAEGQESGRGASVCHLELPCQVPSFPTGRGRRLPLVSSLSDSQLGECCKCKNTREGFTNAPKVDVFREGGTMTSRLELVDAAVQTISPSDSFWGLRRNTSNSNMGSHSLLGSPPGSRLNLKSSVGSNSNLVSPSSSMFPVSSGEEEERLEDDPAWKINSPTLHDAERRRSCLKIQGEVRDKLRRRSSMKQVQWDEEGMTWDIHGATLDPEVLSTAIRKHLELKNSPQPAKRPSKKKKKAPKPPLISNVVKAMTPELNPPAMIITSACMVEADSEDTAEAEKGSPVVEKGGSKKEETEVTARRISRAEAHTAEEDEEVYGEEGVSRPKSPSHGSGHSRKKSVIRSLRPGWCGGSKKADD